MPTIANGHYLSAASTPLQPTHRCQQGGLQRRLTDERPWGGSDTPAVAYVYAADRTASQPITHLAGFKGVLQVDGYAGYRPLAQKGDVCLAFCWAHVRRRFYDRAVAEASPIATEALQRIALLYAVEKDVRGRSPEEHSVSSCLFLNLRSF